MDIPLIEQAVSENLRRPWKALRVVDLNDRASHPCALIHGDDGFAVFAKHTGVPEGLAEVKGLNLIRHRSGVRTPKPIGDGVVRADHGCYLLLEALREVPPENRTDEQWRSIGHALATLHRVRDKRFGLEEHDGYFGPLPQDNRPVGSNRWADFLAQRHLEPGLRQAVDSRNLPAALRPGVERVIARLPELTGPEPEPALVHGDAQQNNFLITAEGEAVLFDAAPHFGHPEADLALVDYFAPVPAALFEGYKEIAPIDEGFRERRELWRLRGYLAVIAVDGANAFGRAFLDRIARAVALYA